MTDYCKGFLFGWLSASLGAVAGIITHLLI